jgi:hypothetical protein
VDDVYVVVPEEAHQPTDGGRIDWALEPERVWRRARASEKVAQPADSVSGQYRDDRVTAVAKLLGKSKYHHLRPALPV